MYDDKQLFGRNMKRFRLEGNMTQEELAFLVNMQPSSIGKIERGEANPTITTMTKIAKAFHLSLQAMFVDYDMETTASYQKNMPIKELASKKKRLVFPILKLLRLISESVPDIPEDITSLCRMPALLTYTIYHLTRPDGGPNRPKEAGYGIRAVVYHPDGARLTYEIKNISFYQDKVKKLVDTLNHHFISISHFEEVVEDFLNEDAFFREIFSTD